MKVLFYTLLMAITTNVSAYKARSLGSGWYVSPGQCGSLFKDAQTGTGILGSDKNFIEFHPRKRILCLELNGKEMARFRA